MEAFELPDLPGRSIGRDIAKGEAVEHELDAFISKRHEQRVRDEGERAVEDAWKERDRLDAARKREELTRSRAEWWGYLALPCSAVFAPTRGEGGR